MNPIHPQTGPASKDDPITTDHREDYGFTFSVSGGDVLEFTQTSGPCTDNDNNRRDDDNDVPCSSSGSDYSVQIYVEEDNPKDTGLSETQKANKKITLTIRWTHGMYAPRTQTFNIMREISMKEWDMEGYDPDHTHQEKWP